MNIVRELQHKIIVPSFSLMLIEIEEQKLKAYVVSLRLRRFQRKDNDFAQEFSRRRSDCMIK